ncbi:MarR family winged helix-turn-helix transcriptional regulator [Sphingomonas aestuarii]
MESPERSLGTLLRVAAGKLAVAEAAAVRTHGVTAAEATLLRELRAAGAVAPSVLADRMGMTRGAVTKLVDRLKAKQLLVRAKGRGDGRMQTIALTGAGARLVPELDAVALRVDGAVFGTLDAAGRAGLLRALSKIT